NTLLFQGTFGAFVGVRLLSLCHLVKAYFHSSRWRVMMREGLVARSVLSESRESVDSVWLGEGPHELSLPEAARKLGAKVSWPRVPVDGGDGMVLGRLKSCVVYC